ncbi:MAG: DUF4367 domain-containing protein [Oscillospiraceae bacterium]|nr:DUF4367 domain-containing protein [Oscillospiraceae bacterium]MDD4413948.1 DUF4367 domain-containing protein [Oscillospiraceae bacterium]
MNKSNEYDALYQQLQAAIDNEMSKPDDEINPDTIKHCVDLLHSIGDYELPANSDIKNYLADIKGKKRKRLAVKSLVRVASLAATFIVIVGVTNYISARAFNFNFINSIIQVGSDFFNIDFGNTDGPLLNAEQIKTELREKSEKEGFNLLLPGYYPQGFSINEFRVDHLRYNTNISIVLKAKDTSLKLFINKNNKGDLAFRILKGEYVEDLEIKDFIVYIIKIEKDYTASFAYENMIYNLSLNNCSYDEFIKVLESLSK